MRDDFHIHSSFSDGEYDPIRLLKMIQQEQIEAFAIADHNNISAIKALHKKPTMLSGVELTTSMLVGDSLTELHVLGYDFDVNNRQLNLMLHNFNEANALTFIKLFSILEKKYNIVVPCQEIENLVKSGITITKLQTCELLVKYGYAKDVFVAYKTYVIENMSSIDRIQFNFQTAIETIKQANGYALLAHHWCTPLLDEDSSHFVKMVKMGLDGFEIDLVNEKYKRFYDIVKKNGCYYSVGSDFHGLTLMKNVMLGKDVSSIVDDKHYIGNLARRTNCVG